MRIRLGDKDRADLNCPEWLALDLASLRLSEAEIIQQATGVPGHEVVEVLLGDPVYDEAGKPMVEDGYPMRRPSPRTWRARVWLALHRAGIEVDLAGLDFDLFAVTAEPDPEPPADAAGKDPSIPASG